jgi:hypothetical protein
MASKSSVFPLQPPFDGYLNLLSESVAHSSTHILRFVFISDHSKHSIHAYAYSAYQAHTEPSYYLD